MRIARNMRQGIKRQTDFPYPDAPDIPLPETDKIIRKHKPRFVLAVTSGKKLMDIRPQEGTQPVNEEMKISAKKATMAMNWLFRRPDMQWLRKLTLQADRFLEKGHCVFKIVENFKSRMVNKVVDMSEFQDEQKAAFAKLPRDQKEEFLANRYGLDPENERDAKTISEIIRDFEKEKAVIKFVTEEVTNLADVSCPLPERIYVPKDTTGIDTANRVSNDFFWSEQELVQLALNDVLLKDKVLEILKNKKSSITKDKEDEVNEQVKDTLEGIDDTDSGGELYRIRETEAWYQPKDNAPFERWLFTYFPDILSPEESLIQWMPYPYEFEGWNYVKHDNEVLDDRYRSARGIPEQIRAIQEVMEKSINNMLIRDELNNAPMYTVRNTANIIADTIRFIPGQKINVNDHDDIRQLSQQANVDVSSERILQLLKAYAEEYVGISDQLFKNPTNTAGNKTLGEIQIGVTETQFAANLDILNWIESVRKVYEKVFFVMQERLTKPLVINGTIITREDFQFIPDITVNGSLELADKALQQQRSQLRLERARQSVQDGTSTLEDLFNAYEDYYEKDGVKEPLDYITDPNEIAKQKITALMNQIAQLNNILQDTQSEIAQADNTLRQIDQQIKRKQISAGGNGNGKPASRQEARASSPNIASRGA
jgi:hypothetical protein